MNTIVERGYMARNKDGYPRPIFGMETPVFTWTRDEEGWAVAFSKLWIGRTVRIVQETKKGLIVSTDI